MITNFRNDTIDMDSLPDWEVVNFEPVNPKYKSVILLRYLIFFVVFSGAVILIKFSQDNLTSDYWFILLIGLVLLGTLCAVNLWSVGYWGYALREHDVLYRSGIFSKSVEIIPYKHVQHVHVKEGLFSRLFHLSSVEVHTAGMGQSLRIPGIKKEKSLQIQDFLSSKVASKS